MNLLKNKNYIYLFLSQSLSSFGDGAYKIALLWLIQTLNESAILTGILGIAMFLPNILFGALFGTITDYFKKEKNIMILSDVLNSLALLILLILTHWNLLNEFLLFALAFLISTFSGLFRPAKFVILRKILREEEIVKGNASIQSSSTLMYILSAGVSGIILSLFRSEGLVIMNLLSFIISAILILFINENKDEITQMNKKENIKRKSFIQDLKLAISMVFQYEFSKKTIPIALLYNIILSPVAVYITVMCSDYYDNNTKYLGFLESSFTVGILLGSLFMTKFSGKYSENKFMNTSLILIPIALSLLGIFEYISISLIAILILGIAIPLFNVSLQSLIQKNINIDNLGKFMGSFSSIMASTNPIGLLIVPFLINFLNFNYSMILISITYAFISLLYIYYSKKKKYSFAKE